jgi:hypothetical protein
LDLPSCQLALEIGHFAARKRGQCAAYHRRLVLEDLTDEERESALSGKMDGTFVKTWASMENAAANAGFQKDDVIVELDGKSIKLTEAK